MNDEERIIRLITGILPTYEGRINKCFESDAEIVRFGDSQLLFTLDEFSKEDMMREDDPYRLGWNISVGGISDILVCGGRPLFYAHSLIIPEDWSDDYITGFCHGIADVLNHERIAFIGGDFGKAKEWRCTPAVIGKVNGKIMMRKGATPGDIIYISGKIGAGNLEAILKLYPGRFPEPVENRFQIRFKEAELISRYATSCIDTSDGVFSGLNTLAKMSNIGYEVADLPYIETGLAVAKFFNLLETLLFLGECGEYEMLFTIKKGDEEQFLMDAAEQGLQFFKLGDVTTPGIKRLYERDRVIDLSNVEISGRDFAKVEDYLQKLQEFLDEVRVR